MQAKQGLDWTVGESVFGENGGGKSFESGKGAINDPAADARARGRVRPEYFENLNFYISWKCI